MVSFLPTENIKRPEDFLNINRVQNNTSGLEWADNEMRRYLLLKTAEGNES